MWLVGDRVEHRNLVGAPSACHLVAIYLFRSGPSLRRPENDHGPARTRGILLGAGVLLDRPNLEDAFLKRGSHFLMHLGRVDALDKVRFVAVADQERLQLLPRNTRQQGWIRNLVAVEM